MSMNNEVWQDIDEFKGYYQVSNLGRVKRIKPYSNQYATWKAEEILTPRKHSNGYLRVCISIDNVHYDRYIHRLVAIAFCNNDNPTDKTEVNHIDGNKTNNVSTNLEWCNRSYNNHHAYQNNLRVVKGCYGQKKQVAQVDCNTNVIISIYDSVENAAKAVGLKNFCNISGCCNYAENPNKYKRPVLTSKGYKWRFATSDMKVGDIID